MPRAKTAIPMPKMPSREEVQASIQERLQGQADIRIRQDSWMTQEMCDQVRARLSRTITGENGWSATLFGAEPNGSSMKPNLGYILMEVLEPLSNWWTETVREAVVECPAPEGATRQRKTKDGSIRIIRTTKQIERVQGELVVRRPGPPSPRQDIWNGMTLDFALHFDGQVKTTYPMMPFSLHSVARAITTTIKETLDNIPVEEGPERDRRLLYWDTELRGLRSGQRAGTFFRDFTRKTPQAAGA